MKKINFKYDYKSAKQICALDAKELVAYKLALGAQAENLKAEATEWALTNKIVRQEMNDRIIDLECELIEAEVQRIYADDCIYGQIANIH